MAGHPAPESVPANDPQESQEVATAQTTPEATTAPVVSESVIRQLVRDELTGATLAVDNEEVRATVRDELTKAGVIVHKVEIKDSKGEIRTIEGKVPESFDWLIMLASARKNILMVGPAGCGKTHLASMVASGSRARLRFHQLLGRHE